MIQLEVVLHGLTEIIRFPCKQETRLSLASAQAADIIQSMRQIIEFQRPEWLVPPFTLDIPEQLKDEPLALDNFDLKADFNSVDRTLAAFCTRFLSFDSN